MQGDTCTFLRCKDLEPAVCVGARGSTQSVGDAGFGQSTGCIRVVKKGSVVSILRVLTKRGGDDEKTADVSSAIR